MTINKSRYTANLKSKANPTGFQFSIVSDEVFALRVPIASKMVFMRLLAYDKFVPGTKQLAEECHLEKRTVLNAIKNLNKLGLLEVQRFPGGRNNYTVTDPTNWYETGLLPRVVARKHSKASPPAIKIDAMFNTLATNLCSSAIINASFPNWKNLSKRLALELVRIRAAESLDPGLRSFYQKTYKQFQKKIESTLQKNKEYFSDAYERYIDAVAEARSAKRENDEHAQAEANNRAKSITNRVFAEHPDLKLSTMLSDNGTCRFLRLLLGKTNEELQELIDAPEQARSLLNDLAIAEVGGAQ